MYERLEQCPNCKHTKFDNRLIIQDHSISKESFALSQCAKCDLLFTNPRPAEDSMDRFYDSQDYISHHDDSRGLINSIYKIARTHNLNYKLKVINRYVSKGQLLDFGCGTGHFLKHSLTKGWNVTGIEPNRELINNSTQLPDIQIFKSLGSVPKKMGFDVITAWHVLEHVHDLRKTFKALQQQLKDNGYLFIAVPNHKSLDAQIYGPYWAGYDVPRHLFHFSPQVFADVAKKAKFKIIDQIPLFLDAYYVSLLSEKYKGNTHSYIRPMMNGFRSNRAGKASGNYSSIIFVLQHD